MDEYAGWLCERTRQLILSEIRRSRTAENLCSYDRGRISLYNAERIKVTCKRLKESLSGVIASYKCMVV